MKKRIDSIKNSFMEKRKKQNIENDETNQKDECKYVIHFKDSDLFDILESWVEYTNWHLNEFIQILALTNKINFPVTLYRYIGSNTNQFDFIDSNNENFSVVLNYMFAEPRFSLKLVFGNESFKYLVNNKIYKSDKPNIVFVSYKNKDLAEIPLTDAAEKTVDCNYTLNFEIRKNTITLQANFLNYKYEINIKILNNINNEALKDKIFANYNFKKIFSEFDSAPKILNRLIDICKLHYLDLLNLKIAVTLFNDDLAFDNICLCQAVITELLFSDNKGYYNLFASGKLIYTSLNQKITITINDITEISKFQSEDEKYFLDIIKNANDMLIHLNDTSDIFNI